MELCSEGSVYDLLCRPENFYGFSETQFVEFFADFGKRRLHLFVNYGLLLFCSYHA